MVEGNHKVKEDVKEFVEVRDNKPTLVSLVARKESEIRIQVNLGISVEKEFSGEVTIKVELAELLEEKEIKAVVDLSGIASGRESLHSYQDVEAEVLNDSVLFKIDTEKSQKFEKIELIFNVMV